VVIVTTIRSRSDPTSSLGSPSLGQVLPRKLRYKIGVHNIGAHNDGAHCVGAVLFRVARFVNWCGHAQELIPVPDEGGWVRLVPVVGTTK